MSSGYVQVCNNVTMSVSLSVVNEGIIQSGVNGERGGGGGRVVGGGLCVMYPVLL